MGMERLTNAFGLLTMVRGICSVAGAPLTGKLPSLLRMRAELHACACAAAFRCPQLCGNNLYVFVSLK